MQESSLHLSIEDKADRIASVDEAVRGLARAMGYREREGEELEVAVHEAVATPSGTAAALAAMEKPSVRASKRG